MTERAVTPSQIVAADLCTGCGGCVTIPQGPARMILNQAGFLRPEENKTDVSAFCPGVRLERSSGSIPYHPVWGPIESLATGFATDPEVRFRGSSGGTLSAIAIHLLESKAVSFILHTKANDTDPIGNCVAVSRTRAQVLEAAGSRYAPSSPLEALAPFLAGHERFAFIGKPCDVAALRQLACLDPRVSDRIPFMLSFFCAGIPARKGTEAVLTAMGVRLEDVTSFRYRGNGWPGLTQATRKDGRSETMEYSKSWGSILHKYLQFRCKICPDGTGEFADIACADAWYGKDGYPDFADRDGRSLVIARTPHGQHLIQSMSQAGMLDLTPLDVGDVEAMQPYQAYRKRNVLARCLALTLLGKRAPRYRGFALGQLALHHSKKNQIRNTAGTWLRLIKKKRM